MNDSQKHWIDDLTESVAGSVSVDHIVDSVHAAMDRVPFAGSAFSGAAAGTGTTTGEVEQVFTVGPNPELQVTDVLAGEISVRAGESGAIRLHAGRQSIEFKARQTGDRVVVAPSWPGPVRLQIEVPTGCRVSVKTVDGEVTVRGTRAPVDVETVNGSVSVEDVEGDSRIVTVSGGASARRLAGTLTWRSMSGTIEVGESSLRGFTLQSVSGDLTLDTALVPEGEYLARTTSANLLLSVPPGAGATVSLSTTSGNVISELPTEVRVHERRRWEGTINGGGARVEMLSVSGDLRITERASVGPEPVSRPDPSFQPVPPSAPVTPPPPSSTPEEAAGERPGASEETTEILRALERGELDVDEAMSRLDALGGER